AAAQNYSAILYRLGRMNEAELLLHDTFDRRVRLFTLDDPATLECGQSLTILFSELGRHAEAAALVKQVADARKRVLGENSPDTIATLRMLASELAQTGQGDQALQLLRQIIQVQSDNQSDPLAALDVKMTYARVLGSQNHLAESADAFREVY